MYEVINPESNKSVILLVEHAGAEIPAEFANLGLPADQFQQDPQMFYDPHSRAMGEGIGKALGLTVYCGQFSRLLVDLNREADHPDVIKPRFHGRDVPGNANLSQVQRQERLDKYYAPFHDALRAELTRRQKAGIEAKLISIHSFNLDVALATFSELERELVDIALLYDVETPMVRQFRDSIEPGNYAFKENYPYDLRQLKTGSILENKKLFGVEVAGIEINAASMDKPEGFGGIKTILEKAIKAIA